MDLSTQSQPIMARNLLTHELIAHHLQADFYFAHPYAAWERGPNENMNGLVRQYFRKTQILHPSATKK